MSVLLLPMLLWSATAQAQDAPTLGPALPPPSALPAPVLPDLAIAATPEPVFGPNQPSLDVLAELPQADITKPKSAQLDSWLNATDQAPETPSPFTWWLAPLGLIAAGVLVWSRKRMGRPLLPDNDNPMTVLSKHALTAQSSLFLMEVQTQDGESRRLLIGVGEKGPVLVSDLGGSIPGFIVPNLDLPTAVETHTQATAEPEATQYRPIQVQAQRTPRTVPTVATQVGADIYPLTGSPRQVTNKGLVGRFTQADLAPRDQPSPVPVIQAWSKPPAAPQQVPQPAVRDDLDDQPVMSTRDLLTPMRANGRRI